MDAYIDFPNFCSYLNSMSNQDFKECNQILLGSCNLRFSFDKSEMNKTKMVTRSNFDIWLRGATTNRQGLCNEWNCAFPQRPVEIDKVPNEKFTAEQLTSIYMLDGEGVKDWAEKGNLLVAPVGEELNVIKKLQTDGEFRTSTSFLIYGMKDWSTVEKNCAPCTDIIIVDPYIFAQSDWEYESNSYALLKSLCRWAKNTPINIVIFTQDNYHNSHQNIRVPFETIKRNLKQVLGDVIGEEPNVTFVIISRSDKHDRRILTNYKMYVSGDSFKYFKNGGLISSGDSLDIHSLYDKRNLELAWQYLESLQNIVNKKKMGVGLILGDQKSLFLNF